VSEVVVDRFPGAGQVPVVVHDEHAAGLEPRVEVLERMTENAALAARPPVNSDSRGYGTSFGALVRRRDASVELSGQRPALSI
jgi:hypothetical protein